MITRVLAGAGAASTLWLCAGSALAANQCFNMSNIASSRAADDHTLFLRVGVDTVYRLDMTYDCTNMGSNNHVVIRSVSGTGQICKPIDVDLHVSDEGFKAPCIVGGITRLTTEEVQALPRKLRP